MKDTNKKNEGNRERKRKSKQWSYLRLYLMLPLHPGKNKIDSQYQKKTSVSHFWESQNLLSWQFWNRNAYFVTWSLEKKIWPDEEPRMNCSLSHVRGWKLLNWRTVESWAHKELWPFWNKMGSFYRLLGCTKDVIFLVTVLSCWIATTEDL
jgi:hypothetical protein